MSVTAQVKNGFKMAAAWLLGIAWLVLVFAGLAVVFSPSKFPSALGWCLLVIAAFVLIATVDRWVKALPGVFGVATINGLAMIFTGHATGSPSVLVSRPLALFATISLAASTLMSFSFQRRRLHITDRMMFLVYAVCVAYAAIKPWTGYWALGTATAALFATWCYNYLKPGESND
jgi:hypothetical protein